MERPLQQFCTTVQTVISLLLIITTLHRYVANIFTDKYTVSDVLDDGDCMFSVIVNVNEVHNFTT